MTAYLEYIPNESDLCLICRETTQTLPWVAHEDQNPNYRGRLIHPLHQGCAFSWLSNGNYFCVACRAPVSLGLLNSANVEPLIIDANIDSRPFTSPRGTLFAAMSTMGGLFSFLISLVCTTQKIAFLNLGLSCGLMNGFGSGYNNSRNMFHLMVIIKTVTVAACLLASKTEQNVTLGAFLSCYGFVIDSFLNNNNSFVKKVAVVALVTFFALTYAYGEGFSVEGVRDFSCYTFGSVVGIGFGMKLFDRYHGQLD